MGICLGNSCMYFSCTTSACFLRSRIGSRRTRGGWALTRLALLGTDGVGSCWTHLVCLLRKLFDGPSRTFSKLSSYRSPFREKSDDVPAAGRSRLSSAPSCARSLASDVCPSHHPFPIFLCFHAFSVGPPGRRRQRDQREGWHDRRPAQARRNIRRRRDPRAPILRGSVDTQLPAPTALGFRGRYRRRGLRNAYRKTDGMHHTVV